MSKGPRGPGGDGRGPGSGKVIRVRLATLQESRGVEPGPDTTRTEETRRGYHRSNPEFPGGRTTLACYFTRDVNLSPLDVNLDRDGD